MNKILASIMAIALCGGSVSALDVAHADGESWWGLAPGLGPQMPFGQGSTLTMDQRIHNYNNQTSPLLVSTKGRYIWSETPLQLTLDAEGWHIANPDARLVEAGSTLEDAYMAVMNENFKPSGTLPPAEFFNKPMYNTWIELMYDQNQKDILDYARHLIADGYPAGVLMIDDNWQQDYGVYEFRPDRFPDPKAMVDELHELGFKVMLWVSPFVSPDCLESRELERRGFLVKDRGGRNAAVLRWWNGHSTAFDLSNPEAYAYFKNKLTGLQERYGIDGFKMDGGDPERYTAEEVTVMGGADALDCGQTSLWAQLAGEFPYNELRACWKHGGEALVQRLGDKPYGWESVRALVPSMVAAGLLGHSYACPDMIGGGDYMSFLNLGGQPLDPRIMVRSCQIHAMMPMMQFSVAPWRTLAPEYAAICSDYARKHAELGDYILSQARITAETGRPIVRCLAYDFPGQGLDDVTDQYMLGDRYMVAPVVTDGYERDVVLPKGKWRDDRGKVHKGGRTIRVDAPLDRIPYFEKL